MDPSATASAPMNPVSGDSVPVDATVAADAPIDSVRMDRPEDRVDSSQMYPDNAYNFGSSDEYDDEYAGGCPGCGGCCGMESPTESTYFDIQKPPAPKVSCDNHVQTP
jgi:hypothetical protein